MPSTTESMPAGTTRHTYGEILKSSAFIGGSSVATIALGIVRTKAMAVLLGPAGVGLLGLYGSIVDLTQSVAGMGTNSSGVRQIAEAVGSGDTDRIARTVTVLRRTSLVLGIFGALLLLALSSPVSSLTFGSDQHAAAVALLSISVVLRLVSGGQGALIQGMRRIPDLAMLRILGGVFGTIISVAAVFFLGEDGVVPSLIGVSATAAIVSWWYSRKIRIQTSLVTTAHVGQDVVALLKLGFAFMASGLMTMGLAYIVRIIVLRTAGFEAAGLYQAAWAVGGLYVGFILQAMGADFYPRLTAVARNNTECNRLVNEQMQVSLLLAGPGVLATLTFAPVVIAMLYSAQFQPAVSLLRWICVGMALRVITWPMGFIILAKGAQQLFFVTELVWALAHGGLAWVCVQSLGLDGAGVAFFASYIVHGLVIYPAVHHLSGFRWSPPNRRTSLLFVGLIGVVFCTFYVASPMVAVAVGSFVVVISTIYSIRALLTLVPLHDLPNFVRRPLQLCGFVRDGH
jgi:PST family polysaccharide transporter